MHHRQLLLVRPAKSNIEQGKPMLPQSSATAEPTQRMRALLLHRAGPAPATETPNAEPAPPAEAPKPFGGFFSGVVSSLTVPTVNWYPAPAMSKTQLCALFCCAATGRKCQVYTVLGNSMLQISIVLR